jgi:hypothetical protein
MDHELRTLRRELGRSERGRGIWYPDPLRERIAAWARARRADGATLREIASEVGVCAASLRRWTLATTSAPALLPIEVVKDPDPIDHPSEHLRITTAAGHKIEGLTIADTIELARVLG